MPKASSSSASPREPSPLGCASRAFAPRLVFPRRRSRRPSRRRRATSPSPPARLARRAGRRRRLLLLPVDSPSLRRALRLRGSCPLRDRAGTRSARASWARASARSARAASRRSRRDARDASSRTNPRPHRWCLGRRPRRGGDRRVRARARRRSTRRVAMFPGSAEGPVGGSSAPSVAPRAASPSAWRRRRRARERGDDREERRARQQDERAGGARAVRIARHAAPSRAPVSRRSVPAGAGDAPSSVARRASPARSGARSGPTRARPTIANAFEAARGYSAGRASTNAALVVVTTRRDVPWRFGPGERTEEFSLVAPRVNTPRKIPRLKFAKMGPLAGSRVIKFAPPEASSVRAASSLSRGAPSSRRGRRSRSPSRSRWVSAPRVSVRSPTRGTTQRVPSADETIPRAPFRDATTSHSAPPLLPPPPQSTRPSLS